VKKSSSEEQNNERNQKKDLEELDVPELHLVKPEANGSTKEKDKLARKEWEDLVKGYSFLDKNFDEREGMNASNGISSANTDSLNHKDQSRWERLQEAVKAMNEKKFNYHNKVVPFDKFKREENEHNKFIKAVELTPSIVMVMDTDCIIKYVNPNFRKVSGYTFDEIVGKNFGVMISDLASHDEYEQIVQAIQSGVSWKGELVNRKKSGEWYILKAEIAPAEDSEGGIIDYLVVGQDVTPIRETEIRLEEALDDKSILLSELHHRVKNNLAILSGMLQLQAFDEPDELLQNKLFSSVGRVKTMATMHELLYESGSFSRLEFGRNIERIVDSVSTMYDDYDTKVKVNYDMEPVLLNINQAHPCSLLVNEVITNVYKHAFKGRKTGVIEIEMNSRADKVTIRVSDNGNGLPEGFKIRDGRFTLGHQLLRTLARQLNGKFEYGTSEKGSSFTLEFKRDNNRGAANARMA
jgi:PAS domain S-box-containing protein